MHYLSILGCNFEKLLPDLKPASSTLLKCKPKMSYLDILKLKFEKTIVIFEIINIELLKIQSFVKMLKSVNMGTKMPYLGYF